MGVGSVQGGPVSDRHEDILQSMPLRAVIVDVAGGHHGDAQAIGQATQASAPVTVPLLLVVLELDEELSGSESALEIPGQKLCGGHAVLEGG